MCCYITWDVLKVLKSPLKDLQIYSLQRHVYKRTLSEYALDGNYVQTNVFRSYAIHFGTYLLFLCFHIYKSYILLFSYFINIYVSICMTCLTQTIVEPVYRYLLKLYECN